MRVAAALVISNLLVACSASTEMTSTLGYRTVRSVPGCGTPTGSNRDRSIIPSDELSASLTGLLTVAGIDAPRCWYVAPGGSIELEAGPVCNTSLIARFRQTGGSWVLESEMQNPIVLCHERVR